MGLPRKHVSFPEDEETLNQVVCEVPNREDIPQEEIEELFFTKLEYQNNRQVSKRISRECERLGLSKMLEDVYVEKSSAAQRHLNEWARQGHERRGLERWSNQDHGEKRQQEQFQAIMTVLQAQDEMLMGREGKVDAEKLRKVSHKTSRVARHFARMIGKADAYAVENDAVGDDETSLRSVGTDYSSNATEITDDNISMPRMPDDLADSRHTPTSKSKKMYNRLPNFLHRSKSRANKGKDDPIRDSISKSRET